jgi:hypothetical protein
MEKIIYEWIGKNIDPIKRDMHYDAYADGYNTALSLLKNRVPELIEKLTPKKDMIDILLTPPTQL